MPRRNCEDLFGKFPVFLGETAQLEAVFQTGTNALVICLVGVLATLMLISYRSPSSLWRVSPSLLSLVKQFRRLGDSMGDGEKPSIVMVAVEENLLNNLRGALAHANLALLHAHSKQEAIALLERLKSEIKLAIVELELPNFDGWELIRRFTFQKPLKIIATTSAYPESLFEKIKGIGVDAVVPKAIASEVWLKTVEKVLQVNEGTTAETR